MTFYKIRSPKCYRDETGQFHCLCHSCAPIAWYEDIPYSKEKPNKPHEFRDTVVPILVSVATSVLINLLLW